jgi:glycerophosphoryl diester phosphodiesterase/beta-glucanase (GH16 family)
MYNFFWYSLILLMVSNEIYSQPLVYDPVIAHRGAWKKNQLPENSIASLEHAIELKCSGTEFDVWMTADDVLVLNHDPDFGGKHIEKSSYAELSQKKLENGESLPKLEDFLKAGLKDNHFTKLVLEIKPSKISTERGRKVANESYKLISALDIKSRITFISFDIEILKELLRLDSKLHTQYLNGDWSPEELKKAGITGMDYHFKVFYKHKEWIQNAKDLGLILNVWTVNAPEDMDFFIEQRFDQITTNEPELLYEKVKKVRENMEWELVWYDEFDYEGLPDSTKWSYDEGGHGWGNNEKQYYKRKSIANTEVKNSKLYITALKETYELSSYTSAKLTTFNKLSMQYGKVEVSAKLPAGKGNWPAIWMLPESLKSKKESWPLCGEIDIMEHVGKDPNVVHVSLHTLLYNHMKRTQITHFDSVPLAMDQFNTYGIEWDENKIKFLVNGKLYFETHKGQYGRDITNEGWPFDKPYFLILNLAIGGNWGGEIDDTIFPNVMEVDYVRIFKKK